MEHPFGSDGDQSGKKTHWRPKFRKEVPTLHLDGVPQGYSYNQLSAATGGFSEDSKVGQGGSGSVYRGVLPSGIAVAVKKINADLSQGKGVKLFKDEISIICRLSHRNLIELLGWCEDVAKNKYLLVYELMPNGSLDDALFGQVEGRASLSWPQRFNVIVGIADALAYLHQSWKKQVLHRDIKSSNIMLDESWNAKVGDFGIARLVDHGQEADISKRFIGTHGYISPEVFEEGIFTDKADVYAFGVVVLEVVCGRRVLPDHSHRLSLVDWVWQSWSQGENALLSTVDKRLQNYDKEKIKVVLNTGLACCHPSPLERPSMRKVVQVLAGDVPVPSIPNSKPRPELYFDPQISITNLLSFKSGNSYRSRSTYISDSAQASPVRKSATGGSVHSHFSIRRILKRKTELTAPKNFAKEKLEVVTEEVGAQQTLHGLHHTSVYVKSQTTKQEAATQAKVDVLEAKYKADTGRKEGRGLGLRNAANVGAETRFCTKNRTAEARQQEVKMGPATKVFEIVREAEVADVPLPDKQQAGIRQMRQPRNVSQADVPSTPLSDKQQTGIGKSYRPSNVKRHRVRIVGVRGETLNSEQGPSVFASGIPVSAKIKIKTPEVLGQRQDMKESRAKRAKQHPKVIQLREWCEDVAKRNPLLTQDLLRFKGHVESVIKRKNLDSWMKRHGFLDS